MPPDVKPLSISHALKAIAAEPGLGVSATDQIDRRGPPVKARMGFQFVAPVIIVRALDNVWNRQNGLVIIFAGATCGILKVTLHKK